MEANHKKNRDEEAEYVKQRDAALKAGLKGKDSWEKVRGPVLMRRARSQQAALSRAGNSRAVRRGVGREKWL